MGQRFDDFITVTATGATIASGASSGQVAIPKASSGEFPRYIRVAATVAASVRLGKTTVAATTADTQIQPGDALIMQVPLGMNVIAAIQVAAAGVVQISPLENM